MGPTAMLIKSNYACSCDADMITELECGYFVQRFRFCMPVLRTNA